nr:hypothetical protein CKG001_20630 [Bdellovibrio sp. CKG001]
MIGAPHSLIRHPDMPRSVFKLFWDTLKADRPIGAYVKNLAGDGSYYWVYAFAFPIEDGYLSIRFKPSSAIFQEVQKIYGEIRDFEKGSDDLEAGEKLLVESIQKRGFKNYEEFMVKAALTELNARAAQVQEQRQEGAAGRENAQFTQIADVTNSTLTRLNDVFAKVGGFQSSNDVLLATIDSLDREFQNLKFISVNMTIAAAKFGNVASSLGVVSKEFSTLSGQIENNLSGLNTFVGNLAAVIQKCSLQASALNVQMLMVDFFVKESLTKLHQSEDAFAEMTANQKDFSGLFRDYSANLRREVASLSKYLSDFELAMGEVTKFITGLEVIRQIGAVESARVDEVKQAFMHYLQQMDRFIQLLRSATSTIKKESGLLQANSQVIHAAIGSVGGNVDAIFGLASGVKAAA